MDTLIGISLIIAGSIFCLWSLYSLKKGRESEEWSTTTGVITKSKIYEPYRKGEGSVPIVHYEYSHNGTTYRSDRIFWSNAHTSGAQKAAQEVVDKYKEGSKVTVYYNPDNAKQSVLETGAAQGAVLWLVVSGVLIVAGIVQLMTGFMEIG